MRNQFKKNDKIHEKNWDENEYVHNVIEPLPPVDS